MIFDVWNFWRVSSEEEHGAVNSGVEISKFSPASISGLNAAFDELVCKSPHFQCGGHGFESRTQYYFGIGYGDGRLCKSLADKFESCISHKTKTGPQDRWWFLLNESF